MPAYWARRREFLIPSTGGVSRFYLPATTIDSNALCRVLDCCIVQRRQRSLGAILSGRYAGKCIPRANFTQAIIDAVRNAKKGTTVGEVIAARENPLPDVGPLTKDEKAIGTIGTNKRGGNTSYTLRRLARDNPALLDKIEAGELSVNQAAIQAGIRKKPQPSEP